MTERLGSTSFMTSQKEVYDVFRFISSSLSILGSSFILHKLRAQRPWERPHVRACLALLVAGSDIFFTSAQIISGVVDRYLDRSNEDSPSLELWCWIIGPLIYVSGWFSLVVTTCIAHYLWYSLKRRPTNSRASHLLWTYSSVAALYAIGFTALFSSWRKFSFHDNGTCWINLRSSTVLWESVCFIGSVLLPVLVACGVLVQSYCDLIKVPECVIRRRNRVMLLYLAVLVFVWSPVVLRHVYALGYQQVPDNPVYRVMLGAESLLLPLQGFLNALVYRMGESQSRSTEGGSRGLRQVAFQSCAAGDTDGKLYREEACRRATERRTQLAHELCTPVSYTHLTLPTKRIV
eukprot:TRINITY_DN60397_c0_g1_i1.p1 TRINITY_DN60397_c0_g1~~TRINITY_DN60397_c0_g1_i1.p1  ORF type:complete len:348 (-),score=57.77 TRINITY_DN60397_c0_g1_i1:97-1140(-)